MIDVINSESKNFILCEEKLLENLIHDICFVDYGCFCYSAPQTPVYRMTLSMNIVLATQTSKQQKENLRMCCQFTHDIMYITSIKHVNNMEILWIAL